jgi:ankyrin repeat protein
MPVASPLVKAAKRRDLRALKEAIRSGADLDSMDSQGWTPLFHAASRGWTQGMKIIIEAGADVNHGQETGFTALFSAVISGRIEAVQLLLEAGARVRNVQGISLAGYAQGKKRPQIVAALERATQGDSTTR